MPLTCRPAGPADAATLAAQSGRAYWGRSTLAEIEERYRKDVPYPLETMMIFERDGMAVGQGRTIPFRGFIGGVECGIGGLASVAVAPEARRTGVASAIVRDHLARLAASRTPWAMLYGYSHRFYARFGWATVATRTRWRYRPAAFPLFPERRAIVRLSLANDDDLAAVQKVYEEFCVGQNGSLRRSPAQLREWRPGDRDFTVGVRGPGGLSGYLCYRYLNAEPRPSLMVVSEWVARDGRAERALLGFVGAQAEQADLVLIDTPSDHPLPMWLLSDTPLAENNEMPTEHHPAGTAFLGVMARIVDLGAALGARGYPGASSLRVAFSAEDAERPDNGAPQTLVLEEGRTRVVPGRAGGVPLVSGPIGALTQVLIGACRLEAAGRMGLISVEGDAKGLDAALALARPYPLVMF
jgi:predicted acetyltransferase